METSEAPAQGSEDETVHCSFCAKSRWDCRTIIRGATGHICADCVDICLEILEEVREKDRAELRAAGPVQDIDWVRQCSLCAERGPAEQYLGVRAGGSVCPDCLAAIVEAMDQRPSG